MNRIRGLATSAGAYWAAYMGPARFFTRARLSGPNVDMSNTMLHCLLVETGRAKMDKAARPSRESEAQPVDSTILRSQVVAARNVGDHERARQLAIQVADLEPEDAILQRLASETHLDCEDLPGAILFAQRTVNADPDHVGHRLFCAGLQMRIEDHSGAIDTLALLLDKPSCPPEALASAARAYESLGYTSFAFKMAHAAVDADPSRANSYMLLASLHARSKDWEAAASAILDLEATVGRSGTTRRALSGYLSQLGDLETALSSIDDAIELMGDLPGYMLHRAGLLRRLSRMQEAQDALEALVAEDPANHLARRQLVQVHVEQEQVSLAMEHAGVLLSQVPDNREYQSCMAFLLRASEGVRLKEHVGDIAKLKENAPPRPMRPAPSFCQRMRSFGNVIGALVLREALARHGRNRLGFFWAVVEPAMHIAVLAVVFQVIVRVPPLGDNFAYFYFSGIAPYLLMTRVAGSVGNSVMGNRTTMQIPLISPFELSLSKLIIEVFTMSIIVLVFGALFWALGWNQAPGDLTKVFIGFGTSAAFGFGIGLIFASVLEFTRLASTVVTVITRVFYFTGGIFFVPEFIPEQYRALIAWNPFLHIVELVRDGAFEIYTPILFAPIYLILCVILTLCVGFVVLRLVTPTMRVQN